MVMPLFNFYLKDVHAKAATSIYMQSKYNCFERLMLTTGEKILPDHWDATAKRAIVKYNRLEYPAINDWLSKMERAAKDYFRSCKFEGFIPTAAQLKAHLEQKFNLNPKPQVTIPKTVPVTVLSYVDRFIANEVNNKSEGTIYVYNTCKRHLTGFIKFLGKKDVGFDEIDEEFYNGFIQYLNSLNFARNTVGKQIKVLKTFLNAATDRGINSNLFFKSKLFKKPLEDVDKIALSEAEIQSIYSLDLNGEGSIEAVRDLFVIACYTGFRFSDFSTLTREHISENFITKTTVKTKAKVIIPIHPIVREILKKYDNEIPPAYTNAHANGLLKEIAQKAKINTDVEIVKTIAGKIVRNVYKKWELVSTHAGRRSFATNSYLAGVPAISIMKMTGHKSEAVFLQYIRVSELENAELIQGHSFFNATTFSQVA
jgi:integrase